MSASFEFGNNPGFLDLFFEKLQRPIEGLVRANVYPRQNRLLKNYP